MNVTVISSDMFSEIMERLSSIEEVLKKKDYEEHRYFTIAEAKDILQVSTKTLQRLRDERKLSFTQFGRHVRFSSADLSAFMKRNHLKVRF